MSESAASREDELDGLRIRRIAAEKRAANRFRSYLIIGGIATTAIAVQAIHILFF